ncbi:autorepressor SdpR family transcription factor [Eubacteriales bacterium OttesenSCG-928-N13]|nr:autorepressor SdpR family transcription factor [Eubacteriales bacterium OttesenSCG-928-N13]
MGDVWNALADPTRRAILSHLRKGDLNAGEIADKFNISKPSISHHLSILKSADLVRSEKQGQNVIYRLNTSVLEDAMALIAGMIGKEDET